MSKINIKELSKYIDRVNMPGFNSSNGKDLFFSKAISSEFVRYMKETFKLKTKMSEEESFALGLVFDCLADLRDDYRKPINYNSISKSLNAKSLIYFSNNKDISAESSLQMYSYVSNQENYMEVSGKGLLTPRLERNVDKVLKTIVKKIKRFSEMNEEFIRKAIEDSGPSAKYAAKVYEMNEVAGFIDVQALGKIISDCKISDESLQAAFSTKKKIKMIGDDLGL